MNDGFATNVYIQIIAQAREEISLSNSGDRDIVGRLEGSSFDATAFHILEASVTDWKHRHDVKQ